MDSGPSSADDQWQQMGSTGEREDWSAAAQAAAEAVITSGLVGEIRRERDDAEAHLGFMYQHRGVTSNRLGHALAALREIVDREDGDSDPVVVARRTLDDDAALRGRPEAPLPVALRQERRAVSEEKTPGRAAYEARQAAKGRRMGADDATPDSEIVAIIGLGWDELPVGMQADEEAGAQAVLDNRTPWGDVNVVVIAMGPRWAVVRSGPEDDDVVKVIAHGGTGLVYYDSLEEWKRANEDEQRAADLRAHVSGMGGPSPAWVTDDAAGVAAGQEREAEQHARDMAAEDGDLDHCEPTL
jgi:hypothetical protein